MADDRDFKDNNTVSYTAGTSGYAAVQEDQVVENTANSTFTSTTSANVLTLGTSCLTPSSSTYWSNANYGYSCWPGGRTLTLKLTPSKQLSVTEYYEEVYKLMSLLKDTNWNITSTKVKS